MILEQNTLDYLIEESFASLSHEDRRQILQRIRTEPGEIIDFVANNLGEWLVTAPTDLKRPTRVELRFAAKEIVDAIKNRHDSF